MYEYKCELLSVTDGDGLKLMVDLGCDTFKKMKVRLLGLNAPEKNTLAGKVAKAVLAEWLTNHPGQLMIRTIKDKTEKYGRYLGIIYIEGNEEDSLNSFMIRSGNAVPYMT